MIVTTDIEHYSSMLFLGIEIWTPKTSHWIKFSVRVLVGSYLFAVNVGSKARYNDITKLLQGEQA